MDHRQSLMIAGDRALLESFRAQYPELSQALGDLCGPRAKSYVNVPCPDWETVTAYQVTIYDNWKTGKRGTRWGVRLKVYTTDPVDLFDPAWETTCYAWSKNDIKEELREASKVKRKHPLSPEGKAEFETFRDNFEFDHYGIMKYHAAKEPTYFHEGHYIGFKMDGRGMPKELHVYVPYGMNEFLELKKFVKTDAKGKLFSENPKTARYHSQIRCSSSPSLKGWVSG